MGCLVGRLWGLDGLHCDFGMIDDYDENDEIACIVYLEPLVRCTISQVCIRWLQYYCENSKDLLKQCTLCERKLDEDCSKQTSSSSNAGLVLPQRFII